MLAQARNRLPIKARQIELLRTHAQTMPVADETLDAILLALVLSVVSRTAPPGWPRQYEF